ncbi:hypothetical protein C8R47DRAFT_1229084 [Mycena vitilis]|nr:hypothetical protein C8R47DRAFT_1229084 [Mycena vitilis]
MGQRLCAVEIGTNLCGVRHSGSMQIASVSRANPSDVVTPTSDHTLGAELISEWISHCLGGELIDPSNPELQEIQARVFIEVLWLRSNHNEEDIEAEKMALDYLLAAQMKSFRAYTTPPPEVSFFHDVQVGDADSRPADLSEGDADQDFEDDIAPKPRLNGNQRKKSKNSVLPIKPDAILRQPGSGKCPKILRPADLEFELRVITYRDDVFNRCGKDITKFVLRETNTCVGGVRFQALSTKSFFQLQDSHRLISICSLKRRASMEAYAYGTMSGRGSRQAAGGWTGDTYAPYAVHQGNTIEDFEALFRQGMDADTLVTAGCSIYPPLRSKIAKSTNKSGLSRFGTLGGTSFYCTNYMSTIHDDEDDGEDAEHEDEGMLQPCIQLEKKNCLDDEYNFGMVRFGIVIQTEENALWLFNPRHEHGTLIPRASSVQGGATSNGTHRTNRRKDGVAARKRMAVRDGYSLRSKIFT